MEENLPRKMEEYDLLNIREIQFWGEFICTITCKENKDCYSIFYGFASGKNRKLWRLHITTIPKFTTRKSGTYVIEGCNNYPHWTFFMRYLNSLNIEKVENAMADVFYETQLVEILDNARELTIYFDSWGKIVPERDVSYLITLNWKFDLFYLIVTLPTTKVSLKDLIVRDDHNCWHLCSKQLLNMYLPI